MASRAINSGVDKIVASNTLASLSSTEMYERSWRDLRNKLDSLLIGTNVLKGDAARKNCQLLDGMTTDERISHITLNWGQNYTERARPLIHQLEVVENEIKRIKTS